MPESYEMICESCEHNVPRKTDAIEAWNRRAQ